MEAWVFLNRKGDTPAEAWVFLNRKGDTPAEAWVFLCGQECPQLNVGSLLYNTGKYHKQEG
jgi:hypothetical protein